MDEEEKTENEETSAPPKRVVGKPLVKYNKELYPLLIESLLQNGLTIQQVCQRIRIGASTFHIWKRKYPEVAEAVKRGKSPVDEKVVAALYKSAIGHTYEEVITEPKQLSVEEIKERAKMENPPPIPMVKKKVTTKYIPPNIIAQIFWLKNRKSDEWKDKNDTSISGKIEYSVMLPPKPDELKKVGETKVEGNKVTRRNAKHFNKSPIEIEDLSELENIKIKDMEDMQEGDI